MTRSARRYFSHLLPILTVPAPPPIDLSRALQRTTPPAIVTSREVWMRKPLAIARSPYAKTVWIDLDCRIDRPLHTLADLDAPLALRRELPPRADQERDAGLIPREAISYNTGVLVVSQQGKGLIKRWSTRAYAHSSQHHLGDQDLLSTLLFEEGITPQELMPHIHQIYPEPPHPNRLIYHFASLQGSQALEREIEMCENQYLRILPR